MDPMPDRPDIWEKLYLHLSNPLWQGVIMAITVALLRIVYDAKETSKVRILSEAALCGALSVAASSVIDWMSLPPKLTLLASCIIGFIGVVAIREMVTRFIGRKVDSL